MVPGSALCLKWDRLSHIWENSKHLCFLSEELCLIKKNERKKRSTFSFRVSLYNFQTTKWQTTWVGGPTLATRCYTLALSHSDAPLVQDASTARPTVCHFIVKLFVSETNKRFTNVFWVSFTKLKSFANLHNFSYHNWSETKSKTLKTDRLSHLSHPADIERSRYHSTKSRS